MVMSHIQQTMGATTPPRPLAVQPSNRAQQQPANTKAKESSETVVQISRVDLLQQREHHVALGLDYGHLLQRSLGDDELESLE